MELKDISMQPAGQRKASKAQELVNSLAVELQLWIRAKKEGEAAKGRHWVFLALLADQSRVVVHQMEAHGECIRVEGQFFDGSRCMVMAHVGSIQFMAVFVPEQKEHPPQREIGFHTGLEQIRVEGAHP
jgi:hypothetical protein